jgi:hypothetical protein
MKNLPSILLRIFLLLSCLSLLGCSALAPAAPTAAASPTAVPSVDPLIIASTVSAARTESVATAYAQLTEAVTATPLPSDTVQATETPTFTPVPPTPTASRTLAPFWTATVLATQGAFQCSITSQSPKSGESLTAGSDFDLAVTLKNTGTEKWSTDNIDFRYLSGTKFQKKVNAIDLPSNVDTGDSIDLVVDMVAGTDTGTHEASWGLVNGSTTFCTVNISVKVK